MALAPGLTIPATFNKEKGAMKSIQEVMDKLGMTLDDIMGKDMETIAQLAKDQFILDKNQFAQEQRQFNINQNKMDQMIQAMIDPPAKPVDKKDINQPWYVKMVHKSAKYWDKFVVKNKFFQKTLDLLKLGLAKAGNFLIDLLKGLLFLSIFDPNGTLMASIIDILTKGAIWLIEILARLAPRIIDAIVVALPRIIKALWTAFWKISQALGKAIGTIISGIGDRLQEHFGSNPFFTMLIELGNLLKDPNLSKTLGAFITGALILSKLGLLGPTFSLLKAAIPFLLTGLGAIATFITSSLIPFLMMMGMFIAPLLPVLLPIIAAIAALVAIFIYAEEIITFFESMFGKFWAWFDKQATWLKVIIGVALAPIGLLLSAIYGLAKAFAFFKKEGFIGGLKLLFTKILPGLWKKFDKWFTGKLMGLLYMFGDFFTEFYRLGKGVFDRILKTLKSTFSFATLRNAIEKGIDYVFGTGTFQKISDYIIEAFSVVTDFLQGFIFWLLGKLSPILPGLKQYSAFGDAGLGASIQAAGLIRETGMDISQAGQLTKSIIENDVRAKTIGKEVGLSPDAVNTIVNVKGSEAQQQEQTAGILKDIRESLKSKGKVSSERVIK